MVLLEHQTAQRPPFYRSSLSPRRYSHSIKLPKKKAYLDLKQDDRLYFPQDNLEVKVFYLDNDNLELAVDGKVTILKKSHSTRFGRALLLNYGRRRSSKNHYRGGNHGQRIHVSLLLPRNYSFEHVKNRQDSKSCLNVTL